jgi:hypothetical protein
MSFGNAKPITGKLCLSVKTETQQQKQDWLG